MNKYYSKFIDFFERHNLYDKEVFDYLHRNSVLFDYRDDDMRPFIGSSCTLKNGKVDKVVLCVPFIDNDITTLINIHEYVHGLLFYQNIGKKLNNMDSIEILPMFYERLFLNENAGNSKLVDYYFKLNDSISEEDHKYKLGLEIGDQLIDIYSKKDRLNSMQRKVNKCLIKKKIKSIFDK